MFIQEVSHLAGQYILEAYFSVVTDVSQKVNELIFGQQGTNLPENMHMKYKKHLARFLTKQKAVGCVPYYGSSCVWLGEL